MNQIQFSKEYILNYDNVYQQGSMYTSFIELRERNTYKRWSQVYNAQMIEVITQKTGNQKSFGVFCKMLIQSLEGSSKSVSFDIYTAQQLEVLRNQSQFQSQKTKSLCCLIMEFDKVNYPLVLQYREISEVEKLKALIDQLNKNQKNYSFLQEPDENFENLKQQIIQKDFQIADLKDQISKQQQKQLGDELTAMDKNKYEEIIQKMQQDKKDMIEEQKREILVLCQRIQDLQKQNDESLKLYKQSKQKTTQKYQNNDQLLKQKNVEIQKLKINQDILTEKNRKQYKEILQLKEELKKYNNKPAQSRKKLPLQKQNSKFRLKQSIDSRKSLKKSTRNSLISNKTNKSKKVLKLYKPDSLKRSKKFKTPSIKNLKNSKKLLQKNKMELSRRSKSRKLLQSQESQKSGFYDPPLKTNFNNISNISAISRKSRKSQTRQSYKSFSIKSVKESKQNDSVQKRKQKLKNIQKIVTDNNIKLDDTQKLKYKQKEDNAIKSKKFMNSKLQSIKIKEFDDISKRLQKLQSLKQKNENIMLNQLNIHQNKITKQMEKQLIQDIKKILTYILTTHFKNFFKISVSFFSQQFLVINILLL